MTRRIAQWTLWPLCVGTFVAILVLIGRTDPGLLANWMLSITLVFIIGLVGLEELLPYRRDWSFRGDRDIWRDIGHYLLYGNVGAILANIIFIIGSTTLMTRFGFSGGLGLWPVDSPFLLQVLLVILIGDALEYWTHRMSHAVPWLWPIHAIHHSPVRLSTLKAGRHHVFYFLARGLVAWLPLIILGAPANLVLWQAAALAVTGLVAHANVDFRIPAFLQRMFVTPGYHRIHHSLDMREGNSNFAVVLPIWDMIFGTYVDPVKTEPRAVGVQDDPIPRSFIAEVLSPITFRRLVRQRSRTVERRL